jgi:hypothetical protein
VNKNIQYYTIRSACAVFMLLCGFCLFPFYYEWRLAEISKNYRIFRPTNEVVENTLLDVSLRGLGLKRDAQSINLRSELRQAESDGNLYYFERTESDGRIRVGYLSIDKFGRIVHSIEER